MSESEAWNLCVDFGTAYSKAAAAPSNAWTHFQPESVRPLMVGAAAGSTNAFLLDSAVFVDDQNVLFGPDAVRRAEQLETKKRQALRSFKTLLSAPDLERALNTSATHSIDPHRAFRLRDLIVLYLAFLARSVDRAVAADPALASAQGRFNRRYASPAWRGGGGPSPHAVVVGLFAEAQAVQAILGDDLFAQGGVPIGAAQSALLAAGTAEEMRSWRMGMMFEATAAAAYSSIGLESSADHLIVVDMGAGTTDIAALARADAALEELKGARVTLTRAGDFIDRLLLNLAIEGAPSLKTPAQQAELWRSLTHSIRDIKESLFNDKRAAIHHNGRTIVIALKDLERDKDFKQFIKMLAQAYEHGLDVVIDRAANDGERQVDAIAVGGGAAAPFIQDMLKRKSKSGKLRVAPRPATPDWAHSPVFGGNLAPIFPQLAISIGGALAPASMLAAQPSPSFS
ncbi:MAG TPA: Hsp70 family protein [Caulobacterales bacterium]|nr:Hsp70 family protein [Caulobacterales bacterium]